MKNVNVPPRRLQEAIGGSDIVPLSLPADPLTPIQQGDASDAFSPAQEPVADPSPAMLTDHDLRIARQVHASFTFVNPEPLADATLVAVSSTTATLLNIDINDPELVSITSSNIVPYKARPYAHNYAGHQFGIYAGQLGDGRALTLGDVLVQNPDPAPSAAASDDHSFSMDHRFEFQLKGCGRTPYCRFGDGHATLRSCIREFLAFAGCRAVYRGNRMEPSAILSRISPSWIRFGSFELYWFRGERDKVRTLADFVIKNYFGWIDDATQPAPPELKKKRAPSVTKSSDKSKQVPRSGRMQLSVKKEQDPQKVSSELLYEPPQAALANRARHMSVLTRPSLHVAEEHTDSGSVKAYIVEPYATSKPVDVIMNRYARFFGEVVRRTAIMIAHWQAVGFCHGVMNTDNMSILGITIDYGPFTFLDSYDPFTASNSSDDLGRYRFEHQPKMALWNLSKLGRCLIELVFDEKDLVEPAQENVRIHALDIIRQILDTFEPFFEEKYTDLMRKKLGFKLSKESDLEKIITPLLQLLSDVGADYTNFFRLLCSFRVNDLDFPTECGQEVIPKKPVPSQSKKSKGKPAGQITEESITDVNTPVLERGSSGCLQHLRRSLEILRAEVEEELKESRIQESEEETARNKADQIASEETAKEQANSELNKNDGPQISIDAGESSNAKERAVQFSEVAAEGKKAARSLDESVFNALDEEFESAVMSDEELLKAWRSWAKDYRNRILLEIAAAKTPMDLEVEDVRRSERMKDKNPKFVLRSWILHDLIKKVEALPKLRPRDFELEKIEAELEAAISLGQYHNQTSRLKRDCDSSNDRVKRDGDAAFDHTMTGGLAGTNEASVDAQSLESVHTEESNVSLPEVDRLMRILIGDAFGRVSEGKHGWGESADDAAASIWSGHVPKWGNNMRQSCKS